MGVPDPIKNCAMQVCCEFAMAVKALAAMLVDEGACSRTEATKVATCVLTHFDLAEAGTLKPLRDSIAKHARGADYKP